MNNQGTNYWLNHSVGKPNAKILASANKRFTDAWAEMEPWPHWLEIIDDFKSSVASLLNVDHKSVVPQLNVSAALTKLLNALPNRRGPLRILLSEQDFPTISFVAKHIPDAELSYIPAACNHTDMSLWMQYISSDIDVLIATHVYSNSGQRSPIESIVKYAKSKGVKVIVDVAQSVGILPIDNQLWQADALLGTSVKWLSGGPGAAFMAIAPELLEQTKPIDVGWFSHRDPFEFDPHNFELNSTADRFMGGTPSVLPFCIAGAMIKQSLEYKVETNLAHNRAILTYLQSEINEDWWASPTDLSLAGGTVVINPDARVDKKILERLVQGGIAFDKRHLGYRFSPNINTTMEDAQRLAQCFN